MRSLRKWENSTTAPSPCVWQTKQTDSVQIITTAVLKLEPTAITSVLINNLMFAVNLLHINTEGPGSLRQVK